jgi:hypothetical protein
MDVAKTELSSLGFSAFDNTARRTCYDYTCTRNGGLYYVEVKGTRGSGASVILTKGEVDHWNEHRQNSIAVIVHHVTVGSEAGVPRATGGIPWACLPWILESTALKPIQYEWAVSGRLEHPET